MVHISVKEHMVSIQIIHARKSTSRARKEYLYITLFYTMLHYTNVIILSPYHFIYYRYPIQLASLPPTLFEDNWVFFSQLLACGSVDTLQFGTSMWKGS